MNSDSDSSSRKPSDPLAVAFDILGVLAFVAALWIAVGELNDSAGGIFGEEPNYLPAVAVFIGGMLAFVIARFVRSLGR